MSLPRYLALVALFAAATLPAATLTNFPSADTYFEAYGSESRNFGGDPVLKIDQWQGRRAFLRFPVENIPRRHRVSRATVRLRIAGVGFNEQGELPQLKTCIALFDVATPWSETGLTFEGPDSGRNWNQGRGLAQPGYGDVGPLREPDFGVHLRHPAIPVDPVRATQGAWLELDVTEFVRSRVRAGSTEINLLIQSSTLGRNYTFDSREAAAIDARPHLTVETSDGVADFSIGDVFVADWAPGQAIAVKAQAVGGAQLPSTLKWSAATNGLGGWTAMPNIEATGPTFQFTPPQAGSYRITCQLNDPETGEVHLETALAHVLRVPSHPRLYVTPESLQRMRQDAGAGERLASAWLSWTRAGNSTLPRDQFHDMGLNEGCENNALAWLITRDRQFLTNSIAYARRMLSKPMREHFDDVHAATFLGASWVHAMALHYDWCYDQLSPDHRAAIVGWLIEAADWGWVRSGAPIAHNDGGARQCLLGSAALALLGDHPRAAELYARSRENFERHLLPWLNDGGQGGRSGDGGEYEGLHAFYIVKFAWMSQTGAGTDVFLESPFFFNRMNHVMFGWYPRPLVERTGAFSLRQYYSPSGDHIRLGYVGDTQPYQSAAALCARWPQTPEAQGLRWLAGDWPTRWMQYTLRWAVLGGFAQVPAREPESLAFFDRGCNTVYMRSDWSDDATWVLFENAPYVSAHGSLDSGTFEIFKGDLLAARTGNLDHANVGAKHTMNYLHRTVAANSLLIHDPEEKWKGFLGGADGIQDGGGQRTNFPLGSSPDSDTYQIYRHVFQRGQIQRYRHTRDFTYASADLAPAYNSPHFHGGSLNRPKVATLSRDLLYLRQLDSVVVFDRVSSLRPEFKKTWLLHSLGDLEIIDGAERRVDPGESIHEGATRAIIRHGWPKPVPSFGRCLSVTLLPENAVLTRIGGREDLPAGEAQGFPNDQWHGRHTHRHLKDFWVNGTNYPPGNPPETRWFGEPGSPYFIPGTPDETGGRGKWRLEVSPPKPATNDLFFHVLCPRLGSQGDFPAVNRISTVAWEGALVTEGNRAAAVFFSREARSLTEFSVRLPTQRPAALVVANLAPGNYRVSSGSGPEQDALVAEDGLLMVSAASGQVSAKRP